MAASGGREAELMAAIAAFVEHELDLKQELAGLGALQARRNLFLGRFGAGPLSEMSGGELLERLPPGAEDSLCEWLQRKQGPSFDTRLFGDISDADPAEFGLWRAADGGFWVADGAVARAVDEDEAIAAALGLRDELVAASATLRGFAGVKELDPAALQQAVADAAPRLAGSAWLHKYLHLNDPALVTRSATAAELDAHLRRLGLVATRRGLYERDARIVQCWARVPTARRLPPLLRYRAGEPPLAARLEAALQRAGLLPPEPARVVSGGRTQRRDLESETGVAKINQRLAQVAARFFAGSGDGPGADAAGEQPPETRPEVRWESALLLRDEQLLLVAGPLPGLPRFVRELEVQAGAARLRVLAANLRDQRFALPVPAATTGYTWTAPDFEDELGEDLARLHVPGLAADRATALRIGAGGEAQVVAGAALGVGQGYALLIPPGLAGQAPQEAVDLGGGWRLGRAEVLRWGAPGFDEQRAWLSGLGLAVAATSLAASWALTPPWGYGEGRGGERYPCFVVGDEPVLCVERQGIVGAVAVFVHGPAVAARRALGTDEQLVALAGLGAGAYFVEVVAEEPTVEIARLPFRVLPAATPGPRAEATLRIGGDALAAGEETVFEGDLTRLGQELELSLAAPPLWPVAARWRGARAARLGALAAEDDGRVDLSPVVAATRAERRRRRVGDLLLDVGELGQVTLRHRRAADEAELAGELARLWQERGATVRAMTQGMPALDVLRAAWVEPACEVLGYAVKELRPEAGLAPPPGLVGAVLLAPVFLAAEFALRPAAALVVAAPGAELAGARAYGLRLCQGLGLRRALLTDGPRFALAAPELRFMPQARIDQVLHERGALEGFLGLFLAEVQP